MIALAGEDPDQSVWVPALCLGEAVRRLMGTDEGRLLDVLTGPDSEILIAVYGRRLS